MTGSSVAGKRILLIVAGGIAAYKTLELIRLLRAQGCAVTCVLTPSGAQFVTPLSLQALSEDKVYSDLFSLTDESEMGHIQLSRSADLLVVAPASADILARMAAGLASDLASTVLLATDKPVLVAPAMNVRMWLHPATQANMALLAQRGVSVVGPDEGAMACNEYGRGRMAEPPAILAAIQEQLGQARPLAGRHAVVTSGPTYEPIDPVRFLGNRSSGRQGHAIAQSATGAGARVTLITGPVSISDPPGVDVVHVGSAREMKAAVEAALPADAFIAAAAVADWRAENVAHHKLKKESKGSTTLRLVENPDILAEVSKKTTLRPAVVIGFAAETENVSAHARDKLQRKGCDLIIANSVAEGSSTFGGETNQVEVIDPYGSESWPPMTKGEVADGVVRRLAVELARRP